MRISNIIVPPEILKQVDSHKDAEFKLAFYQLLSFNQKTSVLVIPDDKLIKGKTSRLIYPYRNNRSFTFECKLKRDWRKPFGRQLIIEKIIPPKESHQEGIRLVRGLVYDSKRKMDTATRQAWKIFSNAGTWATIFSVAIALFLHVFSSHL